MAVTKVTCPHCTRSGSIAKVMAEGAKIRCPSCGEAFYYSATPSIPATKAMRTGPAERIAPDQPVAPVPPAPEVVMTSPVGPPTPAWPSSQAHIQAVQVNVEASQKGNALAIAALVLGVFAALVCWVPFLGVLGALPLGGLGLLLGVIGIILAVAGKRSGLVPALAGSGLSLMAMVAAMVITGSTASAVSKRLQANEPVPIAKAAPRPVVDAPDAEPVAAAPPVAAEPEWVVSPTPARLGDVEVGVASASIGPVPLKGIGSDGTSKDPQLMIGLEVTNTNRSRKLDYQSWGGRSVSFVRDFATLRDDLGNIYKRVDFGFSNRPAGRTDGASLYPGKPLTDVLVFEVPIDGIKHLDLELPAKNVGGEGLFRIRVPIDAVTR